MKKTLLTIALAAVAHVATWAQGYTFTNTTGTYADLVSPTVVSTPGWDPNASFTVPIGFNFVLAGETFTTFDADGFGDLTFTSATTDKYIFPFDGILVDRNYPSTTSTLSPVSYLLTGTAGSRILKLEYKNASTGNPSGSALYLNDFVNFQVWLYEGSNKIEVRYGTSSLTHATDTFFGDAGPVEAIVTSYTAAGISGDFLQGSAAAPTLTTFSNAATYHGLTSIPANGTIYAFTPSGISGIAKDQLATAVSVFPNPATDVVSFRGLADLKVSAPITVSDVTGKVLLTETLGASQQVNIGSLPKGSYMVKILTDKGQVVKHIVKQ